jgi:aspartyl-tRNA(Asn)/glutamyl-tRNA(Gln) amidotransferase subunit A
MTRREWMLALAGTLISRRDALAQVSQMSADELTSLTLAALVDRVSRRALSPTDVTDAYLARIEAFNPDLNAFVTVTGDRARIDAWRASRLLPPLPHDSTVRTPALLGAPIAHKDLFETAGIRTTAGSRLYESHVPARDAYVVSQFTRAGAVMLGKTNTHELGGGVTTINPFFGTTRNPVDRTRIPGGSSGGSAAAVVARLCVAATGSDTGGSVRIPAALCGCVGFKPTFGRISTAGLLGSCPTFDQVGFLTRTVEDAELMFAAALGRTSAPAHDRTSALTVRIGIARPFFFDRLQPDVARAMELAIQRFRAIGAIVDDIALPIDGETMSRVFDPIVISEIWRTLGATWRRNPEAFSPAFATVFKEPPPSAAVVSAARKALADFRQKIDRVFDGTQILMMPTVPVTAPLIEGPIDGALILRNTWPFNAAGTPAMSIPCGADSAGLPIGLQLVARRQQDQLLLSVARMFDGHPVRLQGIVSFDERR